MNKIYLITSGEYSDYTVHCFFEDRERAEKYCMIKNKSSNNWYEYEVEELNAFNGEVNYNSIKIEKRYLIHYQEKKIWSIKEIYKEVGSKIVFDRRNNTKFSRFDIEVIADNEDKAKKIVYDKMAKYFAQESGL